MNFGNLKEMLKSLGARGTFAKLREAEAAGEKIWEGFSIKEAALAFCGEQWYNHLNPGFTPAVKDGFVMLHEAGDGVDVTAFSNITGQYIYNMILQGYQNPAFIGGRLAQTIPTRLSGERLPGIQKLADSVKPIGEGMPYPRMGFGEDYQDTPETVKRGFIVPVTKEAIFFDRTNLVAERASRVGEWLGLDKEERILDVVVGNVNNYNQRGTANDTYQESAGAVPFNWINQVGSTELVDWTDVDVSEQLFSGRIDPDTGKPILIIPRQLLVMPAKLHTARMIVNATEVETRTASAVEIRRAANPLQNYEILSSPLLYQRMLLLETTAANAQKFWFHGDFPKAFAYMENWGIMTLQAPANNSESWDRDIVLQYKTSERGVAISKNPRFVNRLYQTKSF